MTETLSERLCKECGVELKYWCSYHSCICPIQDVGKFNPKCPKQAVTKECDARSKEPRYPDFENNNNNFVKLLNTNTDIIIKNNQKIPCKPIWWIINERAYMCKQLAPYDAIDFLLHLILILKGRFGNIFTEEGLIKIKTAIKNQSWEI